MGDGLSDTLRQLLASGADTNAAFNALLSDYDRYHVVLVVVGSLFLAATVACAVFFWRRFASSTPVDGRRWTFEKKTYLTFGVLSVAVALFLALIVAANVSTVANPRQGFAGAVDMLDVAPADADAAALQASYDSWLRSGDKQTPALVGGAIDDRLAWQRPKAIICTVLLIGFVVGSALIWRALLRRSRERSGRRSAGERLLLLSGVGSVMVCLLLMLMVIGNTQGSLAPLSLTLFFG